LNIRILLAFICSMLTAVLTGCAQSPAAAARTDAPPVTAFDAADPSRSGYQLVFHDEFDDAAGISFSSSEDGAPGFRWYARLFAVWGGSTSAPEAFSMSDGILTIAGGQLGTAAPARNANGFVGTTFANGAYFEARIAFDAAKVRFDPDAAITKTNWWPSFYAMPIEYFTKTSQWPGQAPGFAHFAEDDFFEAWLESRRYGGAVHDWYGLPGCHAGGETSGYCEVANDGNSPQVIGKTLAIKVPEGTDWRQFHVIGQLWVSGKMTGDKRGFVQFYFDGKPTTDRVGWRDGPMQGPPPAGETAFSILDQDHLVVYIGSPAHTPLRVDWVRVWQLPSAAHGAD
jgi:hypothetical protein